MMSLHFHSSYLSTAINRLLYTVEYNFYLNKLFSFLTYLIIFKSVYLNASTPTRGNVICLVFFRLELFLVVDRKETNFSCFTPSTKSKICVL